MQPRIQEVLTHLDAQRRVLEEAVAVVPEEARGRRPAPDRWSATEILEHLVIVEDRIARLLADTIEKARTEGLGPEHETSSVVLPALVARVLDRSHPVMARENAVPSGRMEAAAARSALADTRRALRETILAADGLALGELALPHPRLGPLNLYHWIVFVGAHESRHAAQIREVAAALAG